MSMTPTACLDQPHRLATDENLRVVSLAPAERRDVPVLAQWSATMSFLGARPERSTDVRVGPVVEQQSRERRVIRPAIAVVDQLCCDTTVEKSAV
jgi:hypothetical protein